MPALECTKMVIKFANVFLRSIYSAQDFMSRASESRINISRINQKDVSEMPFAPIPASPRAGGHSRSLESVDQSIDSGQEAREGLRLLKESASDALLTGRVRVPIRYKVPEYG